MPTDNLGVTVDIRDRSHLMHVNIKVLFRSLEEDQVLIATVFPHRKPLGKSEVIFRLPSKI